ncbi:MAG: hypothetical protein NT135_01850 [Candidatus Berkelbacteria bacterium]|nr:hypothetical protein [Candidatus Berkelbacteria bacterium]
MDELLVWANETRKYTQNRVCSKKELKDIYFNYEDKIRQIWCWGYLPFLIDDALEIVITDILRRQKVKECKISEIIKTISAVSKKTLHEQEEYELLKLAKKAKKYGFVGVKNQINNHLKKWGWKKSWIYSQYSFSRYELEKEIKVYIKKNTDMILKKIHKSRLEKINQRKTILTEFNNRKLNNLADILSEYNYSHNIKME